VYFGVPFVYDDTYGACVDCERNLVENVPVRKKGQNILQKDKKNRQAR